MSDSKPTVIESVRRALGRGATQTAVPAPPAIDEPITRLVHSDIGLPELFAKRADELKMGVTFAAPEEVAEQVVAFLRAKNCRKVALAKSSLLEGLGILLALHAAGIEAHTWDEITLDELYNGYDCGITDVTYAVAETGTLVIRPTALHGRGLTLVPMYHIAIVEPRQILPDLLDLFERVAGEPDRSNLILISGPSKTADIEMNVVTGVHGPNVVQTFILR
jgi:L-lactate dehydrogenase complex protein LldG